MGVMFPEEMSGVAEVDEETGLSVAWLRDEPPRENRSHFVLSTKDGECTFSAGSKGAYDFLREENPKLSTLEVLRASRDDKRLLFVAVNIELQFDPEVFVRVWHRLIKKAKPDFIIKTTYRKQPILDKGVSEEWSFELR